MVINKSLGDIKAQALADDPVLFVRAFDREPWPFQADILRAVVERDESGKFARRFAVLSLPRQNGKSTLSAWLGLYLLFTQENQQIVTVALDADQARIIFGDARMIIVKSGILSDQVRRFTYNEIELSNGNRWQVKSSESVSSRGLRPSVVLIDELGWAPDRELFDVLSAAQAAQDDPLTIITSTVGPIQAGVLWELFELARAGDESIRLMYFQENLSPKISDEFLEQQRAILPAQVFAREHLNTWGAGSEAFCSLQDWNRARGDTDPRRTSDPGPSYAFLDLGWTHDESVLAVAKVEDGKTAIIALETWQGSQETPVNFASIESRIKDLAQNLHIKKLTIESPQGVMLAENLNLQGVLTETLHPTSKSQNSLWGGLYASLKNGSIWLPDDARLRRQLLTLTIKTTASGWKVVDDPSIHQDRALACGGALRMCEAKPEPFGVLLNIGTDAYKSPRVQERIQERSSLFRRTRRSLGTPRRSIWD